MTRIFLGVALALLAVGNATASGVAVAADRSTPMHEYCVIAAVPIGAGSAPEPMRCFASRLAAEDSISASAVMLGRLYDYANVGGRYVTITGGSCDYYGVPDLRTYSFNDLTTSLDNYCGQVTLYTAINYSGTARTYGNGRTNYVGDAMNNQATAVVFKP